ncbi:MAG: sigma-70 family RNA polymerase sigma factor [Polyangiales bacterium]
MDDDVRDMLAVSRGDRAALARLYDRHAPLMLALGQRLLRDRREAEDVLHDVFVEAWQRAGDFDPARGSPKTWLTLRMRSRCLDRLKSAGRARTQHATGSMAEKLGGGVSPGMSAVGDASRMRRGLEALPESQRQVMVMGYFDGLSCSEIAEELGVPIGTVKSRMAAAMSKLKRHVHGTKETS